MLGRIELLSEADCDRLAAAAFEILRTIGIRVEHEGVLSEMAAMGCNVDVAASRAYIPESVVVRIVDGQRAAETPEHFRTAAERSAGSYTADFFHSATQLLDWKTRWRRRTRSREAIDMIRLADVTPEVGLASCPVIATEIDPNIAPVYQQLLLVRNARRFAATYFEKPELVPYFTELGRISTGSEKGLLSGTRFVHAPLTVSRDLCEMVSLVTRAGVRLFEIGTLATAGLTAPVTAAGTVALGVAEILGGWVVGRAIAPDVELFGVCRTGVTDVLSGGTTFSSPESVLQDAAIVELFQKRFGGRTRAVGAAYIGAKATGIQAAIERAFKTVALGSMSGWFTSTGCGMLDNGMAFCPAQAMLDIDYGKMLWHFNRGIQVDEDKLAAEALRDVVLGGKSFVSSSHTAQNFRESMWFPELFSENPLMQATVDTERLLKAADAKWRDLLKSYVPVELDPAVDRALREVLRHAAQSFGAQLPEDSGARAAN